MGWIGGDYRADGRECEADRREQGVDAGERGADKWEHRADEGNMERMSGNIGRTRGNMGWKQGTWGGSEEHGVDKGEYETNRGGGRALIKNFPHLLQFADMSSYVDIFHHTCSSQGIVKSAKAWYFFSLLR